jgi:electron transport complex protein RnfC
VDELINLAGGYVGNLEGAHLIAGGPMTGNALISDELVVHNSLGSVIVKPDTEKKDNPNCMGCGKCAQVCPVYLTPIEIKRTLEAKDVAGLKKLSAERCIQCGLCSYICPSRIELTEATAKAKATALKG